MELSNAQITKLKSAVNNPTGATLRVTRKMLKDAVSYELLLTTRQKTKFILN